MKILFINSVCGIGSTGRLAAEQAERYMAQGHVVKIAYGRGTAPEKYQAISHRIGSELQVRINGLAARLADNEGFNAHRQTEAFLNWATAYDPDVLWLHNLHGYYLHIEKLFDWIKSRPGMQVRWTLHDCWAFTGHCAHFAFAKCDKWQTQCSRCPQSREYPKGLCDHSRENFRRKREAFCGVKNMTIITPSHWLANLVKQSYLGQYPVEVVHNEIDTTFFKPTQGLFREIYGLQDKKIVLGVATAWGPRKGLQDFVQLQKILPENYQVVLVGLTPKQIHKLPKGILGLTRTDSATELAAIYTAADVFVNLTYEDTYPTVNLEAQACLTPCLTYRTGGSVESVPEENVVNQGDLTAIAEKICKIC